MLYFLSYVLFLLGMLVEHWSRSKLLLLTVCFLSSLMSIFAPQTHSCYPTFLKSISLLAECSHCCSHFYMIFYLSAFKEGIYSRSNNYFIGIIYSSEHDNDAWKLYAINFFFWFFSHFFMSFYISLVVLAIFNYPTNDNYLYDSAIK